MEKSFEVGYDLVQPLTRDLANKLAVIVGHCDLLREHLKAGAPSAQRVGSFLIRENVGNQRVIHVTLRTDDTVYALVMRYRIGKDKQGTTLACLACNHTERVQDFKESVGNPRTLAAQAMLKHIYAEHSRETHMRAMAMVMERQHAPR
jgi:hypothetical protein